MKIKFANKPVVEKAKVTEPIEEMIKITKEELDSIIDEIEEEEELEDEFEDEDIDLDNEDYLDEDDEEITE